MHTLGHDKLAHVSLNYINLLIQELRQNMFLSMLFVRLVRESF